MIGTISPLRILWIFSHSLLFHSRPLHGLSFCELLCFFFLSSLFCRFRRCLLLNSLTPVIYFSFPLNIRNFFLLIIKTFVVCSLVIFSISLRLPRSFPFGFDPLVVLFSVSFTFISWVLLFFGLLALVIATSKLSTRDLQNTNSTQLEEILKDDKMIFSWQHEYFRVVFFHSVKTQEMSVHTIACTTLKMCAQCSKLDCTVSRSCTDSWRVESWSFE